jgi:uncharacterized paraquat-inducible protein A
MEKQKQKIQCPRCGSDNTITHRHRWIWFGIHSLILSAAALVFVITIPFLFVTIPAAIIAFAGAIFEKENKVLCRKCKFKFKMNKDGTHEALKHQVRVWW